MAFAHFFFGGGALPRSPVAPRGYGSNCHLIMIWNHGAVGFLKKSLQQQEHDMRSVPDLITNY